MLPQRAACSEKTRKPPSQTASWLGELLRCLVGVLLFRSALVTQTPSQDLLSKKKTKNNSYSPFWHSCLILQVPSLTGFACANVHSGELHQNRGNKKKNPIKKSLKVNVWWGWKNISNTQLSSTERRENKWSPVRRIGMIYRPSTIFYGNIFSFVRLSLAAASCEPRTLHAACFCSWSCSCLLIPDCHQLGSSCYEAVGRERQKRKPCHILMGGQRGRHQ